MIHASFIYDCTPHYAYLFTGKERDSESDFDYFGARYMSSNMGRFVSPDWSAVEMPVPYASLQDPQSLNLYSYVLNNPMTSVDSDGHDSCKDDPDLCRAVRDAVAAGHSIADGWANRLNELGNSLAKGLESAKSSLDTFNSTLGFGKTNCAGGGSCNEAFGMAVGGVIAAVASDGESEAAVVEEQLTKSAAKIDRIMERITVDDLSAASREANGGMRVAKSNGSTYSHVEKLEQFATGLDRQATHLEGILKRTGSGLSEAQTNRLTGYIEKARSMIGAIRRANGGGFN